MSIYKNIIFDLDGTLLDTSEGIFNSVRYTEDSLGIEHMPEEDLHLHVGPPVLYAYEKFHNLDKDTARKAVKFHREYSTSKGIYEAKVYNGIPELLKDLKDSGFKLYVATLKRQDLAEKVLEHFQISQYFDLIVGINNAESLSKADMINIILSDIGGDKKSTILIGDSEFDAIGAAEAGIDCLAVTYGFGFKSADDIKNNKIKFIAKDICEIKNFLA